MVTESLNSGRILQFTNRVDGFEEVAGVVAKPDILTQGLVGRSR